MTEQVLSEVGAVVAPEREAELVALYRELVSGPLPEGLVRTELLRGPAGHWRVQSLWRDMAALEAVRNAPERPAAPRIFRLVGTEPELTVHEVVIAQVGELSLH
ncbi:antibiotic biosynthesis monooxygenase [Kitasatospora sp. DSM 101779]|uniref:antibiotic biosynthesis monooxygenase n=1 Tax=Kitasatospora sp. DSM 101779 TaxID=2853165 RepID=UPI0021D80548|nr:antibiotic biosynthesis monooxygenase [Kitasatospora sp. DSM 101779]MCU7821814.1 antibiotic biosynthesis monooxygenase [Kitasatospora sp. DSM 101779]